MIKQAVRLYGRSVLAGVLGTFIYLSIGVMVSVAVPRGDALSGTASFLMNLISLLLQGTIFFLFIYGALWSLGDKDANAVHFGHLQVTASRGFKIGCLASIPSMISFLVLVADKLFLFWGKSAAAYRVCQVGLYPIVVWAMGPTAATTTAQLSWGQVLCAGIPVLFLPIAAGISYYLGFKQIVVADRMMFVNKKK
ncbi:MAG: hypothetical protein J6Q42_04180 [Clostridia bacterium]|nr:hypothetical protein [Clostridia bacterium]